jgi:hypothetical protein
MVRLKKQNYMEVHEGLPQKQRSSSLICKLEKALYGLKQSPCQWYRCLDYSIFLNNNDDVMKNTKKLLSNKFQMLNLRSLHLCLGMDIKWIKG